MEGDEMGTWCSVDEMLENGLRGKEFSDKERLESFIKVNKFTRCCFGMITTTDTAHSLKSGRAFCGKPTYKREGNIISYGYHIDYPPYSDHVMNFKRKGENQVCMTYSPYIGNKHEDFLEYKAKIKKWANERGLIAEVIPPSKGWYYPDAACFVIIRLPDYNVEIPKLMM